MKFRSADPFQLADCLVELARLFGAPLEQADIAALFENGRFDALQALAGDPRHAVDLRSAIAAVKSAGDPAAATSRLNSIFCRLFLGLGPTPATLPIESAHRAGGRLFQEPAEIMSKMLATHGLCLTEGFAEPPDHLAVELSLLEQFIRLEASLVDIDKRVAISALHGRLVEWTPEFAEAVAEHDPSGFYAALAHILVRLLDDAVLDFVYAA